MGIIAAEPLCFETHMLLTFLLVLLNSGKSYFRNFAQDVKYISELSLDVSSKDVLVRSVSGEI